MANTSGKSEISEASGIGHSALIIRTWWKCRFQELEARNDNGIDGMIFIKKNTIVTGEIIHVQVKGGSGYKIEYKTDYKDYIGINLGEEYINTHRPRWNLLNEPVILIFVDDQKSLEQYPDTWWIDLKSDDSYSKTAKGVILIHKTKNKN